jgi:hypothetical protein
MKPLGEPKFNILYLIHIILELNVLQIIIGKLKWSKWGKLEKEEKKKLKTRAWLSYFPNMIWVACL